MNIPKAENRVAVTIYQLKLRDPWKFRSTNLETGNGLWNFTGLLKKKSLPLENFRAFEYSVINKTTILMIIFHHL